jgi:hypothetical protein
MSTSNSRFIKRQKRTDDSHDRHLSSISFESSIYNNFYSQLIIISSHKSNITNTAIFNLFYNSFQKQEFIKSRSVHNVFVKSSKSVRRVSVNSSRLVHNSSVNFLIEKEQRALNLLNQEHIENLSTFSKFSECITSNIIRKRVFDFHMHQNSSIENFVCCSCDIFIKSNDLIFLNSDDSTLSFLNNRMNTCAFKNNKWDCCRSCHKSLQKNKISFLSITNMINVIMCDEFSICLSNLTISKECLIARSYSLKIILRLRSNEEQNNFVKYFVIREHFIILSQNSKFLWRILSNLSLKLNDKIKMIWIDKNAFTRDDIRFYVMIKKRKIWKALYWLSIHNSLYKNVHIDMKSMKKWKKKTHILWIKRKRNTYFSIRSSWAWRLCLEHWD